MCLKSRKMHLALPPKSAGQLAVLFLRLLLLLLPLILLLMLRQVVLPLVLQLVMALLVVLQLVVVLLVLLVLLLLSAKNARVECHSRIALYVHTCSGCMLQEAGCMLGMPGCMLEKAGCMLWKASYLHPLDDLLQEVKNTLQLVVVLPWQPGTTG